MQFSQPDIMMIEAFVDGELEMENVPIIEDMISIHPELMQLYNVLKAQRIAIKKAFLIDSRKH